MFVALLSLRRGMAIDSAALFIIANSISTILLMNSISLPLMYRFGAEKARMIYILSFAGFGALLGGFGALMDEVQTNSAAEWLRNAPAWLAVLFLVTSVLVYAVSWRVSVKWYGKYKK